MVLAVVTQVATLAQAFKVSHCIVFRVMVQMGRRQDDHPISPYPSVAVSLLAAPAAMQPALADALAAVLGTGQHRGADILPVRRVAVLVLRPDRHVIPPARRRAA